METNELLFPAEMIQFAKFCHTDDVMVKYYLVVFTVLSKTFRSKISTCY